MSGNALYGNHGSAGNTLEDLLGIEDNLPIPNAAEWELKTHRMGRCLAGDAVPQRAVTAPCASYRHACCRFMAGRTGRLAPSIRPGEMSFRQTISGNSRSDRGFKVVVDRAERKVRTGLWPQASGLR